MSLQRVLWRLIAASVGYLAAIAASIVVLIMGLGIVGTGEHLVDAPDAVGFAALVTQVMRGVAIAPVMATVVWPGWLIGGLLTEVTGSRRLAVHLIGAALISVGGVVGTMPLVGIAHVQSTAAAGLVAGFVHWLIAGRSAGLNDPRGAQVSGAGDAQPPHA